MNLLKRLGVLKEKPVAIEIKRTREHEAQVITYNPKTDEVYCMSSIYVFSRKDVEFFEQRNKELAEKGKYPN